MISKDVVWEVNSNEISRKTAFLAEDVVWINNNGYSTEVPYVDCSKKIAIDQITITGYTTNIQAEPCNHKCNCDIVTILQNGCRCGGI